MIGGLGGSIEGFSTITLPTKAIEAGLKGALSGSSVLRPCTVPWELTSAQTWLRYGSGPLTPAHLRGYKWKGEKCFVIMSRGVIARVMTMRSAVMIGGKQINCATEPHKLTSYTSLPAKLSKPQRLLGVQMLSLIPCTPRTFVRITSSTSTHPILYHDSRRRR